jgi:hypothetical protein
MFHNKSFPEKRGLSLLEETKQQDKEAKASTGVYYTYLNRLENKVISKR